MRFTKNYLPNVIRDWLDRLGYEPPVAPANPDWIARIEPKPDPWRIARQFMQAAQAKDLAAKLPDGDLKLTLVRSSSLAISELLDDTCGTPSRHWPWPGPPPWVWQIASELSSFANSLTAGSLRDDILDIAAKVISHSAAQIKVG
jgi:hypothetical protein